jgi:glutamyl/glutaminyl-tRNA synthetase
MTRENSAMKEIRTRYAPSPTGYMHIGNLRTALYEYLIAKANNGKFILRIEDTDQERYVEGSVDVIYKTLKLAGLQHDEGPDIGGPYGPYIRAGGNIYILNTPGSLLKWEERTTASAQRKGLPG